MKKNFTKTSLCIALTLVCLGHRAIAAYQDDQAQMNLGRMQMTGGTLDKAKDSNASTQSNSTSTSNALVGQSKANIAKDNSVSNTTNQSVESVNVSLNEPSQGYDNVVDTLLKQAQFWHDKYQHKKAIATLNKILLTDPYNEMALYLMALWSYEVNDKSTSKQYRDKLSKISPNSSYLQLLDNQQGIENLSSDQLAHARALSASGNIAAALIEYQKLFSGSTPPKALVSEYYLTMSGDPNYYDKAVNGIVNYIKKNPKDTNAQLTYGKLLTFRKATIRQGIEILEYFAPSSQEANKALKQALLWLLPKEEDEKYYSNYLKRNPKDEEIKNHYENTIIGKLSEQAYASANVDSNEAILAFEKILEKNPHNQEALEAIGYLYNQNKEYLKASNYLEKAANLGGSKESKLRHDAKLAKVKLAMATGNLNGALEGIEEILNQSPYDIDSLLLKADIYKKLKQYAKAQGALQVALGADPNNEAANEMLYYLYKDQGKLENAKTLLEAMPYPIAQKIKKQEAPVAYRDPILPIRNKAQALIESEQYSKAIETLQEGLQQYPKSSWLKYDLAKLLYQQNLIVGYKNQLNALSAPNATNEDLFAAASLCSETSEYALGLKILNRVGNSPKVSALKQQLIIGQTFTNAEDYLKVGNTMAAYNTLQMLQVPPSKLTTAQLGHLSYLYLKCSQQDKALELANLASNRSVDKDASIAQYLDLINVYNETGNYDKALQISNNPILKANSKAQDLDKIALGDTIRKADALRELSYYADAYDLLYPYIQKDPNNIDLNLAMARIYQDNSKLDSAYSIYQRVLSQDPSNQGALIGAINIALLKNDQSTALRLSSRLSSSTNDPNVLTLLAKVDAKNNRYQAAMSKLTKARALVDDNYNLKLSQNVDTPIGGTNKAPNNPFKNKVFSGKLPKLEKALPWDVNQDAPSLKGAYFATNEQRQKTLDTINRMLRELKERYSNTLTIKAKSNQKDGESGLSKLKSASIPITFSTPILASGAKLEFTATPMVMDAGTLNTDSGRYEHGTNALQVGSANLVARIQSLREEFGKLTDPGNKNAFIVQNGLDKLEEADRKLLLGDINSTDTFTPLIDNNSLQTAQGRENLINFLKSFKDPKAAIRALNVASNSLITASNAKTRRISGVGLNAALVNDNYKLHFGVTPIGKEDTNVEAGIFYRHVIDDFSNVSFDLSRSALKDSLLSYYGYEDKLSGTYFGSVTKNGALISYNYDNGYFGFNTNAQAYAYRGHNVADNKSFGLGATAYVHTIRPTEDEDMTVGVSLTYQDFEHNQNHFSFGHGGYFSPQNYIIASIPFTYRKRAQDYELNFKAEFGYQSYTQQEEDYYPTNSVYQRSLNTLYEYGVVEESRYAKKEESSVGGSLQFSLDYHILDDLVVGGKIGYNTFGEYKEMSELLYIKSILGDL